MVLIVINRVNAAVSAQKLAIMFQISLAMRPVIKPPVK